MLTIKKIIFSLLIIIFCFSVFKSALAITETGVEITQLQEESITKNSITLSGEYSFENWGLKYPHGFKFVYGEDPDNLNLETGNILTEEITPPFAGVRSFTYTIGGLMPNTNYFYNIKDTNNEVLGEYMPVMGSFITEGLVVEGIESGAGKGVENTNTVQNLNITTNNISKGVNCIEENNNEYCFLAPLPGFSDKIDSSFGFGDYVNSLITLAIGIAIVLAILMIVIGGVQYMSTDAFSGKQEGRERITNALIGLIIALGAYTILNTTSPNLVNFNVSVRTVSVTADEINFEFTEDSFDFAVSDSGSSTGFFKMFGDFDNPQPSNPAVQTFANKMNTGQYNLIKIQVNAVGAGNNENNKATFVAQNKTNILDIITVEVRVGLGSKGVAPAGTAKQGDFKTPEGVFFIPKDIRIASNQFNPVLSRENSSYVMGAAFINTGAMISGERYIGFHGNYENTLKGTAGCVRMYNDDLVLLAPFMKQGTLVEII